MQSRDLATQVPQSPRGSGQSNPEPQRREDDTAPEDRCQQNGQGDRLGQGAGFYDRALTGIPRASEGGPLLVAVVYADELLDESTWPVEPHDIRMDDVITIE